jgi:hypothetical protein
MNKETKGVFFAKIATRGGRVDQTQAKAVLRGMKTEEELEEMIDKGLGAEVRDAFRTTDDDGIRLYYSLDDGDGPAYHQTALFVREEYQAVVDDNEERIRKLIATNEKLADRAKSEGFHVQLMFELDKV